MIWLKTIMISAFVLVLILMAVYAKTTHSPAAQADLYQVTEKQLSSLKGKPIELLIARTWPQQYQGLSDREPICEHCGMLFLFSDSRPRTFVMRRMNFSLDIVWIQNNKIIRIDKNLPPEHSEPFTPYASGAYIDTVLEIPAGAAAAYDLKVGDAINLS